MVNHSIGQKLQLRVNNVNTEQFLCLQLTNAQNNDEIGWVTPEPASIHARFDQFQDEGPKATIIAYMLQLALAKYQMLNLNLQ